MDAVLLEHELWIRVGAFAVLFAGLALGERLAPRRRLRWRRRARWLPNLGLAALDAASVRLLLPAASVGAAALAGERGWGLFARIEWPGVVVLPLSVLVLDLAVYLQHLGFHAVPALWRLHLVHHADPDLDVTTGLRFHPGEVLLSLLWKAAVVIALGAPVAAVLVFELLLNGTSMFNHGNLHIPRRIDRWLRWLLVTPDMHRVHHSVDPRETNRNFGFNFPWWDRLFRTYRDQPAAGHTGMALGIEPLQGVPPHPLGPLLLLPLRVAPGRYPLWSRGG